MGQYTLLAVVVVAFVGAVVLFNAQKTAQAADDELTGYHEDRFGRELALVGLKETERLLSHNPDEWGLKDTDDAAAQALFGTNSAEVTYTKNRLTGTYKVTYDQYVPENTSVTPNTPELAYVTATGTFNNERFTVKAVYELGETDIGIPPSARATFVAENELYFNGATTAYGGVHTNGDLTQAGNSGRYQVYGPGSYVPPGTESVNDGNYSGGVAPGDSIYIPPVVIPTVRDHYVPTGTSFPNQEVDVTTQGLLVNPGGATTVTGNGTFSNPYVIVVNGDVTVDGDLHLGGYTKLFVNGNMTVNGNHFITPTPSTVTMPDGDDDAATIQSWVDTNLPDGNQIGIYVTGDFKTGGSPVIAANIFANGNIDYWGGGGRLIIGSFTSREKIDTRGNASIFFTSAASTIYEPGGDDQTPDGVRLVSYREWAGR